MWIFNYNNKHAVQARPQVCWADISTYSNRGMNGKNIITPNLFLDIYWPEEFRAYNALLIQN
jgi:hypothetical protein